MLNNLHVDYVKAAAPRPERVDEHVAHVERAKAPPGRLRVRVATALAGAARRLDRESARRALA